MIGGTTKIPEFKNEVLTLLGDGVIIHHLEERATDCITFGMICRLIQSQRKDLKLPTIDNFRPG